MLWIDSGCYNPAEFLIGSAKHGHGPEASLGQPFLCRAVFRGGRRRSLLFPMPKTFCCNEKSIISWLSRRSNHSIMVGGFLAVLTPCSQDYSAAIAYVTAF